MGRLVPEIDRRIQARIHNALGGEQEWAIRLFM